MQGTPPHPGARRADSRRWKALIVIALAQLMVVLDTTVVNISLPSAQHDLGISDGNRQWVITAYSLAFGGLLLLGGRIADLAGRRRMFIIGLVGFAGASALGGAAVGTATLLAARALQGVFGALLAPAALSLLAVTFSEPKERAKAFGIYGAVSGGGGALGLILGGVLTQYLSWRWALYVNIPFAVAGIVGAVTVVREPDERPQRSRLDIPGVLLATSGLVLLVLGFSHAETHGWHARITVLLLVGAVLLLAVFVLVESRVATPLLPLRVVTDRNRGGVYLSLGLSVIGMFGLFLFLTYYLQVVKGYTPVVTGLAFLPMILGMVTGSTQIGSRLMNVLPPRVLMGTGFLVSALGILLLTQLKVESSYAAVVLPAQVLLGLGMGTAFMPATSLATHRVQPRDAGVASAMVSTSQQVGGSIGTALLNTVASSSGHRWAARHLQQAGSLGKVGYANHAAVHGYTVASWCAVSILGIAALAAFTLIQAPRQDTGPSAATDTEKTTAPALHG
ncbi:Puromycin resistance protein pur8 [Streptomyces incarnatus]|uniref:Puromycin resistance protein pur8 n=1 Tax=Streptomyces incarnatus TaxID=665007 RepID=A0ABN4GPF0_9ACTN|nr:MFS transporter [Streptomyces incarnatus]AKJ12996.1 Puromycin resistance protein pur8 [Streptomyces incarnatus]